MKMRKTSSLTRVMVLILFGVFASTSVKASGPGWYVGALVGESSIEDPGEFNNFCSSIFSEFCADEESDTAFQGIVGYQANNFVSMELAYFDLGSPAVSAPDPIASNLQANVTGGAFSVLPQLPIGSIAALYGRLGVAVGKVEVEAKSPLNEPVSASTTGGTLLVGVGGAVNLGQRVTVRVEWTRYAFDESLNLANIDVTTPDIDVVGAALIVRFPKIIQ